MHFLTFAFFLALCLTLTTGCNAIFFQPDDEVYSEPSAFSPPAEETFLPIVHGGQGDRIHLWTLRPVGTPKGVIVHFHGNAQNLTSHVHFLSWLTREGYALVAFDYRGYGKSSGTPSREKAIEDGVAAIAYAATLAQSLEGGRVPLFVVAQSLGGALGAVATERYVRKRKGAVSGLVLDSTFGSWRSLAQKKLAQSAVTWPVQVPLSYFVTDESDAGDALARLDADLPLFQTHAVDDVVVPFEAGLALFRSSSAQGLPQTRFLATTGGHTSAFAPGSSNVRAALVAFLESVRTSTRLAPPVE